MFYTIYTGACHCWMGDDRLTQVTQPPSVTRQALKVCSECLEDLPASHGFSNGLQVTVSDTRHEIADFVF
jgi:hypothetical protein